MTNLNYGIIGNCKSAALISDMGAIDWCCLPHFNSSSVFAKILDKNIGGTMEIIVSDDYTIEQKYLKNTNILRTRFTNGLNQFDMLDFMPRYKAENGGYYNPPDIIRYLKLISGKPELRVNYKPKLRYARFETVIENHPDYIKSFTKEGEYESLYLYTDLNKESILDGEIISLTGDSYFLISYDQKILDQNIDRQYLKLQKTKVYWLDWSARTISYKLFQDEIIRSSLVLKLLTYDKSGAVLAAATTSLPETIGEIRNWDYRYCWIRDASMVVKVMSDIGHLSTVRRFMNFIIDIIPVKDEKIQIMYGINGEKNLREEILEHLSGYENSAPVRIGNAAFEQRQNDIYGVLMDVIFQQFSLFKTDLEKSESLWTITRSIVKVVQANWQMPDKGIWEIRGEERQFTFSKVLCWVAIDRAVKIAGIIGKERYIEGWVHLADMIREDIHKNAWSPKVGAFTQSYGSEDLDASVLLMEPYGFIDGKDEKYIATVNAACRELCNEGLMYRYKNRDDFGVPSSSFTICNFWLINALIATGQYVKAKQKFTELLALGNHLGLFSEDLDFKTRRLLGNFPQGYSHLAIIEVAINLSRGAVTDEGKILGAISH